MRVPYAKKGPTGSWDPIVARSLLLVGAVIAFGTAGYTWIEGWAAWRSFFFTLVTLTTVGYGDYGLSQSGERFTAVLMVGGIGTVSYTISLLLQRIMARAAQPERRMIEQVRKMSGHYIVCGLGRTGQRIIRRLEEGGGQVVALDADADRVEEARLHGIAALTGDATSDVALLDAGVKTARAVAAVTPSDAVNAMICLSACALAPETPVYARAEDESSVSKLRRAGAAQVISPTSYGGDGIAQTMLHPELARLLPGLEGEEEGLHLAQVRVGPGSDLAGQTIADVEAAHPRLVFVAARSNGGDFTVRPAADRRLGEGDVLVVAGAAVDVAGMSRARRAA